MLHTFDACYIISMPIVAATMVTVFCVQQGTQTCVVYIDIYM